MQSPPPSRAEELIHDPPSKPNHAPTSHRFRATASALAAGLAIHLVGGTATARSLTVLPVNIEMAPKQMSSTLTVINNRDVVTSVQIRTLAWKQVDGKEVLTPSNDVMVSPPIAAIAPGATQIARLVLRKPAQGQEGTCRVLLDQIPPVTEPATVRMALRLSSPISAAPATRAMPHVKFRVENDGSQAYLVAVNDGNRHDTVRETALKTTGGTGLNTAANSSPHILAGATRRWPIGVAGSSPAAGDSVHLTGTTATGAVDQRVPVVAAPYLYRPAVVMRHPPTTAYPDVRLIRCMPALLRRGVRRTWRKSSGFGGEAVAGDFGAGFATCARSRNHRDEHTRHHRVRFGHLPHHGGCLDLPCLHRRDG
jgi:fimbrial chaperone protein